MLHDRYIISKSERHIEFEVPWLEATLTHGLSTRPWPKPKEIDVISDLQQGELIDVMKEFVITIPRKSGFHTNRFIGDHIETNVSTFIDRHGLKIDDFATVSITTFLP